MAGRRCQLIYFTGNLVGTLLTGYVIKRIGLTAAIIWPPSFLPLAVPALADDWILELVGLAFCRRCRLCMIWVVVESALMCSGTSRNRGVCLLRI